jgi:osmoprotectant transport system ATP-binding protein
VRFESVTVRYANTDRNAVEGVTLDVPAGSFTVFVGPSGCGKSTLLRTVNRLVPISAGRVRIDETDNMELEPVRLRRSCGYAIQAVGLFAHMTVGKNIAVVPELCGWPRARITARIDELLTLVRLDPARYRYRYPRQLSGGEAQRVGVARAIAAEPRTLLMDEPFGAVDAIVRASLQDEAKQIAGKLQTTVLFVTHDVDEALGLADTLVIMREGRIEQTGTPLEILASPANDYVRDLVSGDEDLRAFRMRRAERARAKQ